MNAVLMYEFHYDYIKKYGNIQDYYLQTLIF